MESDCCGASEWMEDTGICSECKEHADWNDEETDTRWVLLEEGYAHTVLLTKEEAELIRQKNSIIFPHLSYELYYDEYYEFLQITKNN